MICLEIYGCDIDLSGYPDEVRDYVVAYYEGKDKKFRLDQLFNAINGLYNLTVPNTVGHLIINIHRLKPKRLQTWIDYYEGGKIEILSGRDKSSKEFLIAQGTKLYIYTYLFLKDFGLIINQDIYLPKAIDWIKKLVYSQTYEGYLAERHISNEILKHKFNNVRKADREMESLDIDYIVDGDIGITIKPHNFYNAKDIYCFVENLEKAKIKFRLKKVKMFIYRRKKSGSYSVKEEVL